MVDLSLIFDCAQTPASLTGSYSICTDTRQYSHPQVFFAYPGARYNPLEAVGDLLAKGCPLVVYEKNDANEVLAKKWVTAYPQANFVSVSDMIAYTQDLGTRHAKAWQKNGKRIFAISGSNGKTTHKEMLSFLLQAAHGNKVVATEKNNNNHLGVPLTLLRITPETEVCVLELGSNHPGEIKVLCDIAQPQSGLVTNIGATHLEFFGGEKEVFLEEGYLQKAVEEVTKGEGLFLQNLDDNFLATLPQTMGTKTFSRSPGADFQITSLADGVKVAGLLHCELHNASLTGMHNKQNMAVSWIAATLLFPKLKDTFTKAAAGFRPTKNRSEWCEFQGKQVYLDAYNANPSSMKAALEGFFDKLTEQGVTPDRALIVLGDMNELGDKTPEYHRDLGSFLKQWPTTSCAFVGRFSQHYQEGLPTGRTFPDASSLKTGGWTDVTHGKTHVFIKGSRSLQLESLVAIT